MKKLSIILTIIISFLFMSNVNAEELKYDQTKPFEHLTMTNTIDLSDEEVTTLMKKANYTDEYITKYLLRRNYALQNNKSGKYYFVNPGNIYNLASDRIFINLSSENIKQGWIEISNSRDGASTDIYYNIESNDGYTYYTYDYSTTPSTNSSKWFASNNKLFQFTYNSNNVIYNGYNLMCLSYFYETNMKGQLSYKKGAFGGTSDIIVDDVTYSINDTLPITLENGYHSLISQGPKINISSTLKNELGEIININFSEFDKEKYIYLYNFNNQPGNENWHEITENDFEYTSVLNGTLYVQAIDKQTFNETKEMKTILSATYTFTKLLMYEDVIDTYNMSDYTEVEYRYYGNNPSMFYYSTYRYGQVPEDIDCITGTGFYECNLLSIKEIISNFYYYTTIKTEDDEYLYKRIFAYEDKPTYSIKEYDHAVIEDFSKYPVNSDFFYNHYRSFTLDLSMYLKEENRGRYVYVYYSTDIYDKTIKTSQSSWNNDTNTNNKLDDLNSETIKPPTYQENTEKEDNYFLGFFIDLINKKFPIINQLSFIISTFSIKENDDIPNLTVDLSSMGIPGKVTLIDIETYKQCREMLFFFEYFGICMIGIPKIINNIKSSLGGDK